MQKPKHNTTLVLLGTGTPNAEADRAGSSLAIIVDDVPYLVDFGPGVVRRANNAYQKGITALAPEKLCRAFLTHLHTDHTAGYADLIFTPWVLERKQALRVWGPPGIKPMTEHILSAYQADIQERLEGLEPANPIGYHVDVAEIQAGFVYEDERVRVEAFAAKHGSWQAMSYKFITDAGVIVISGDTAPYNGIAERYQGCDILVHEVYSKEMFQKRPSEWQSYHRAVRTSTQELAAIAAQVKPKKLVLYHQLFWGQSIEGLLQEIRAGYDGTVISGSDLDVFELGE